MTELPKRLEAAGRREAENIEKWRRIPGFDSIYMASSFGRIKSSRNGRDKILKQTLTSNKKYYHISIKNRFGKRKTVKVHRLVGFAFGILPKNASWKIYINHKDGNGLNNNTNNLEKSNPKHNMRHAFRIGLNMVGFGDENPNNKLSTNDIVEIFKMRNSGQRLRVIAKKFKTSTAHISNIYNGKVWPSMNHLRKKAELEKYLEGKKNEGNMQKLEIKEVDQKELEASKAISVGANIHCVTFNDLPKK